MKKVLFLAFSVITFMSYSQEKFVNLTLSSGISTPSTSFKDKAYAENGSYFKFSGAYYFSKFGFGVSLGQYTNATDANLERLTSSLSFSTANTTEDWKVTYYGFGPEYTTSFNKIQASLFLRTGIMNIKPVSIESSYSENVDIAIPIYDLTTTKTSKISYLSTAIKLGYKFTKNLSVFATVDYMSALSNEFTITEKTIADLNRNGIIDLEDILKSDGTAGINYDVISTTIKPQSTNFGIGLSYNFGNNSTTPNVKRKRPGRVKYSDITLKRNPVYEGETTNGESPLYVSKNKVSITLTNSTKEKADEKNKQRKLVNVLPKNNSRFKSTSEIKNFTWKLIGSKISNPHYIIEVIKISSSHQVQLTYISKTTKTTMNPTIIFKENKLSYGQYSWKVTETTTGISSNSSSFTVGNCEIDFTISNDTIECLGYVGANRKFKICFDTTYSSASGDLTFANLGSGLSVYDQSYTPLTYTLVSPNPTLVTQIGATTSTVSYCFEVTVSTSVTSISFGLQGDDLDPSPIECKPGVSLLFDELPSCLCDECEDIDVSFDDFNISLNGGTGNQFNFNGNMNVNVPIYGIEFQVQSYSYTANPGACTEGVSSVEESGMLLMPGTTINGSTSLQLFNETASGSTSSNNNATKDIKYTSNSPLTGPIPINLTIGLPGPISGLDPSCCVIDYTVCIKVKVFYEDGNCKSCEFTQCFNFNNQ